MPNERQAATKAERPDRQCPVHRSLRLRP